MRTFRLVRALYLVMCVYVAACAVVMLDRSGIAGEDSAVASAALAIRETLSGDDPFGVIDAAERLVEPYRRVTSGFNDAGQALD